MKIFLRPSPQNIRARLLSHATPVRRRFPADSLNEFSHRRARGRHCAAYASFADPNASRCVQRKRVSGDATFETFAALFRDVFSCADSATRNALRNASKNASENTHRNGPKNTRFFATHFVHAFLAPFCAHESAPGPQNRRFWVLFRVDERDWDQQHPPARPFRHSLTKRRAAVAPAPRCDLCHCVIPGRIIGQPANSCRKML
jgi:hypothetical protein